MLQCTGSRTKKLVPVMIRSPCQLPNILRHITLVDYTKYDVVEWFWDRLRCSIMEPIQTGFEYANPSCIIQENKTLNFKELSETDMNLAIPEKYLQGPAQAVPRSGHVSLNTNLPPSRASGAAPSGVLPPTGNQSTFSRVVPPGGDEGDNMDEELRRMLDKQGPSSRRLQPSIVCSSVQAWSGATVESHNSQTPLVPTENNLNTKKDQPK